MPHTPSNQTTKRNWIIGSLLAVVLATVCLWSWQESNQAWSEVGSKGSNGEMAGEVGDSELLEPSKGTRTEPATSTQTGDHDVQALLDAEEANDGWGRIDGTALINGLPLELGKVHWIEAGGGEQGFASIEQGQFEFDAPTGEVQISAWIIGHRGYTVVNHSTNGMDPLTKVQMLLVMDASPNSLQLDWQYEEVLIEGDVLSVPSMRPLADTTLGIDGGGGRFGALPLFETKTDAAGLFHVIVPKAPGLKVTCSLANTQYAAPVQAGWTALRIPDTHEIGIRIRDGRTGESISDYDLFYRVSATSTERFPGWQRHRINSSAADSARPQAVSESTHILHLPSGKIDLLVYAPRLGLRPHQENALEIVHGGSHIDITLQPGGTLAFSCEEPPATGLVNPGYDPDPILVVDQRMFDWKEPTVQAFGGHVDREGVVPRNLLFTRRVTFNMKGEAVVKGLPAGTYRVLHWREGVNWRSEALEVVAGVTTNVRLVAE